MKTIKRISKNLQHFDIVLTVAHTSTHKRLLRAYLVPKNETPKSPKSQLIKGKLFDKALPEYKGKKKPDYALEFYAEVMLKLPLFDEVAAYRDDLRKPFEWEEENLGE